MAPPKKQRKVEESVEETGNVPEGTIHFALNNASTLGSNCRITHAVKVRGVDWYASISRRDRNGVDMLHVYLHGPKTKSLLWTINANYSIVIVHPENENNIIFNQTLRPSTFDYEHSSRGNGIAIWSDLVEKDFFKDDKLVIKIQFSITKVTGIRQDSCFDYKSASEPYNSIVLMLNGEAFHVSKELLAMHSPVFKTMFFGPFIDKSKKIIPLEDVDAEEFRQILHALYPSRNAITDANVDIMLKLADRFEIKIIIDLAEDFIISSSEMTLEKKLLLAEQYRLVKLQDDCMVKIAAPMDVKKIKETSEFGKMSENTKALLLVRTLELIK